MNKLNSRAKRKQMLIYFPVKLINEIREFCDSNDLSYSGVIVNMTALGWRHSKVKEKYRKSNTEYIGSGKNELLK